jgi:hypothetical protein
MQMRAISNNNVASGWFLLILTISGQQPALRMRTWRSLKALGVGVVRDGVYVLPNRPQLREALQSQADEVVAAGGSARLLEISGPNQEFATLFDRTADYARLVTSIKSAARDVKKTNQAELSRLVGRLRKDFEEIVGQDFFPNAAKDQARGQLDALTFAANQILAPGEPHAAVGQIKKLHVADYQNRTWATRKRPWIDRLATAWLIHRFIDANAKIKWLDKPEDCPKRALGFDFDGARFTHIGGRVTFEVLSASFGLDSDAALEKLGAMVHYLDVGGIPVAEAAGFEAVVRGARQRFSSDDEFLAAAETILDFVHAGYCEK